MHALKLISKVFSINHPLHEFNYHDSCSTKKNYLNKFSSQNLEKHPLAVIVKKSYNFFALIELGDGHVRA